MRTLACRDGRCDQCQGCSGCECHASGPPADFKARVEAARVAAEARRASELAEVRAEFESAGEGS